MAAARKKTTAAKPKAKTTNTPKTDGHGYTVLARRCRPQTFGEVIGQGHVAQALQNAIRDARVAHGYLFTGTRGVGKTSMARIFSKALCCVDGPTAEPCGKCEHCTAIAGGDAMDVLEIDGASNNGVDEVRDIRANVNYRPGSARFKIYIIDEVHMLSPAAFNALLKTLEEPPPHVKFIFATTEAQKIPATIMSRCQRFDFAAIAFEEILERLRQIAKAEKVKAEPEALEAIARRANGSMRDGQSLLDQVLAFGRGDVKADDVHKLIGSAGDEQVHELVRQFAEGNAAAALETIAGVVAAGTHVGEFVRQLLDFCRDLMVLVSCGADAPMLGLSKRQVPEVEDWAKSWGLDRILAAMQVLSEAGYRVRTAGAGRIQLEMAAVEICQLEELGPLAQMTARLEQLAERVQAGAPPSPGAGPSAERAAPAEAVNPPQAGPAPAGGNVEELQALWPRVVEALGAGGSHKVAALAVEGRPVRCEESKVVVGFTKDKSFHRQQCEAFENRSAIERALAELAGRSYELQFAQIDERGGLPGPADLDKPAAPPAEPDRPTGRYRRELQAAMSEPLVRKVVEMFDGRIVKIDWRGGDE